MARALPRVYKSAGNDEVVLVFGWLCVTRLHGLSRTANRWSWPIAVNRETQADLTDAHHARIRGQMRLMLVKEPGARESASR